MTDDFDNTNSGVLFRNDDKKTGKHPDYRGTINVDGSEFWLSAWIKTQQEGREIYVALPQVEER